MKRIIVIFIIALGFNAFGQGDVEFKAANFKDDKDGFKKAKDAFDLGSESWLLGNEAIFEVKSPEMHYWKALKEFDIAYAFNPNSAELNFKMAVCYFNSTHKEEGLKHIFAAHKLNHDIDPFMDYYLGVGYQLNGEFDKALMAFKNFEANYKKADRFNKFVKQRKQQCSDAKKLMGAPIRAWIDHVPVLCTVHDEYAPTVTMDGSEILFTSNRPNPNEPNEVGRYDDDIYASTMENGKWAKPKRLEGKINSTSNDISNNYSYDGTKMVMCKLNDAGNYDIYESFLHGDSWSEPVNFSKNVNLRTDEKYASYNFNDKLIYYAKNNNNSNGYDIYVAGRTGTVKSREFGLPAKEVVVSTPFNDGPIYLHPDGKTMYFASEGFNSMGGYDIFMSKKSGKDWSAPVNMGYPVNTPYDDFFFAATANGKYAYISSNRAGGKGGFDIYKVTFWGEEKAPSLATEDYLLASIAKPIQDPELVGEVKVANTINLTVFKGKTIDALTKKAVEAIIEITDNTTGKVIETFTTNSATGKFLLSLASGGNYGIAVKANGYLFHSENFNIPDGSAYNLVNKTIELKNIKIGSKIALRNVFFDTGKSTIKSESNAELDRLVKLMKDVPGLKIELSGHTDNTGSAQGNIQLSQDRAEAVMNYLASKGIAKNRMTAKGYGPDRPVASNSTSEGRQLNRRTEFEITGN